MCVLQLHNMCFVPCCVWRQNTCSRCKRIHFAPIRIRNIVHETKYPVFQQKCSKSRVIHESFYQCTDIDCPFSTSIGNHSLWHKSDRRAHLLQKWHFPKQIPLYFHYLAISQIDPCFSKINLFIECEQRSARGNVIIWKYVSYISVNTVMLLSSMRDWLW